MILSDMESSVNPFSHERRKRPWKYKKWKKTRKTNSVWNSYISPFGRSPGVKGEKRTRVGPLPVRNKLSRMTKFRGRFSLGSGTRCPLSILGLDPLHLFLLLLLPCLCIVHSASRLKCPPFLPYLFAWRRTDVSSAQDRRYLDNHPEP